jgi:hypothetical protein
LTLGLTPSAVADADLAAIWSFDEGSGTTSADLSGNGNTATLSAAAAFTANHAPTPHNVASLNLGGAAYASAVDDTGLDMSGNFSISAWEMWEPAAPPVLGNIVSKDSASGATNYNLHVGTFGSGVASAIMAVTFTDQAAPVTVGTVTDGTAGCDTGGCYVKGDVVAGAQFKWHHVAGVYTQSTHTLSVYVDGALAGQASFVSTGTPVTNTETVQIGQRKYGTGDGWNGTIDEVRIYSRALATNEIAALADYSKFMVQLTPDGVINTSTGSHTVDATIDPPLAHIPVDFDVSGRNTGSGFEWTDAAGATSFEYTDNGGSAGVYDTISASVGGGDAVEVTKYWVNAPDANYCALSGLPLAEQQVTAYDVAHGMLYSRDIHVAVPASGIAPQNICLYFANASGETLYIPAGSFTASMTPKGASGHFDPLGFAMAGGFADQTDFAGVVQISNIKLQKGGLILNTHLELTFNDGTDDYTIPINIHFSGK